MKSHVSGERGPICWDFGWYKSMGWVLLNVSILEYAGATLTIISIQVARFIIGIGVDL